METKIRGLDLLETEECPKGIHRWHDAQLKIGIKGQKGLTVNQLFTIERLYKNWNTNWKIKLAVWLIGKTEL